MPIWKAQIGQHNDVALIQEWDNGKIRAFASGYGHVLSMTGDVLISLGKKVVPHGQELRVGDFLPNEPGLEMIIRYDGHKTKVITVNNAGEVKYTWKLNSSPNETVFDTPSEAHMTAAAHTAGLRSSSAAQRPCST